MLSEFSDKWDHCFLGAGKVLNHRWGAFLVAGLLLPLASSQVCLGQGAIVSAGGPVHRGMGGASTAAPLSALSALYWNPAKPGFPFAG